MVRQVHLIAVVSTFLLAVLVVGCAAGDPGNNDGRGGKRSAAATKEETTAPEGDRSKSQTAQEPVGLDAKVVSPPDQGNLPVGFGEGSLWAIGSIRATPPSASATQPRQPSCQRRRHRRLPAPRHPAPRHPAQPALAVDPAGPPNALRGAGPADRRGVGNLWRWTSRPKRSSGGWTRRPARWWQRSRSRILTMPLRR